MNNTYLGIAVAVLMAFTAGPIAAQEPPDFPARGLSAEDTPSDGGQSLTLAWTSQAQVSLMVMRSTSRDEGFESVGEALASDETFTDLTVEEGTRYYYRLAYEVDQETYFSGTSGPVVPRSLLHRPGKKRQGSLHTEDIRTQRHR
jgi:hypothetical protein